MTFKVAVNRIAPAISLGVLIESGRPISRIRWMKLLFLLRHEANVAKAGAFYDFLPYRYGPYSFFADRDLRIPASAGRTNDGGRRLRIAEVRLARRAVRR